MCVFGNKVCQGRDEHSSCICGGAGALPGLSYLMIATVLWHKNHWTHFIYKNKFRDKLVAQG